MRDSTLNMPKGQGHRDLPLDTFPDMAEEDSDVGQTANENKMLLMYTAKKITNAMKKRAAHARYRARYKKICRQLKIPPLSRFVQQMDQRRIDLGGEAVGKTGVHAICAALLYRTLDEDENSKQTQHPGPSPGPSLEAFDLSRNNLDHRAVTYIQELISKEFNISELTLHNNTLGGAGVSRLTDLVTSSPCLKRLDISANQLKDKDGVHVAKLMTNAEHLCALSVSHNELSVKAGIVIGNAIGTNTGLRELNLSWNHLRGKGAECISLGIMRNSSMRKLDISWNGFGFEGSVAMSHALRSNTTLTDLDMSSNRIHPPAVIELFKGVVNNKTLAILRIGHNPITSVVTTPLLCQIRDHPTVELQELDLSGVVVDRNFEVIWDEIRERRPCFKVIYDLALPVHRAKWEDVCKIKKPVYNVDPVRILYYTKKNLRLVDLFNKMDTDGNSRLSRSEVHAALKKEKFDLSSSAIDTIFDYLDKDKQGSIGLLDFLHGERDHKRKTIRAAEEQRSRSRLEVEAAAGEVPADLGGHGRRFSTTYRPELPALPQALPGRLSPLPPLRVKSPAGDLEREHTREMSTQTPSRSRMSKR